MKRLVKASLLIAAALSLAACAPASKEIVQAGWFETFAAGDFKGLRSLGELSRSCDMGIGTFENIDGEMILLDGKIYRVSVEGVVSEVQPESRTPFALAIEFSPDASAPMSKGMDPKALQAALDAAADSSTYAFLAVKAKCKLAKLKLRSVPAAHGPFPDLAKVVAAQRVFEHAEISGTLIGFRTPPCYKGINVPGYHFHFLSDDRKAGGHVLDFEAEEGVAELEICDGVDLKLPSRGWTPPAAAAKAQGGSFHGESSGK